MNYKASYPKHIDLDYSRVEIAASLRATARERGNPMTFFIKRKNVVANDLFIIKWSSDHHVASLLVMTLVVVLHNECPVTKQMR
jgi:hypothetical protein